MTDLIGFVNLASGIIQIGMALFVLFSDPKDGKKRYYFLSAIFLGLWSLSIYFFSNPFYFDTTTWLKIVYTMAYCMTFGLILFAKVYPVKLENKFNRFSIFIGIYMLVMTGVVWFTDLVVVSTSTVQGSFTTLAEMGPLYLLYGLPEFITAIYVVGYYFKQARISTGIEKKQIQHYVVGGIIMLIPVFVFDFIFPLIFKNSAFYKYSTIGNFVWTLIVGYSVLRTRFLDIKVVIGSVLGALFKSTFVTILLVIVTFVIQPLLSIDLSWAGILKLLMLSIIIALFLGIVFKKIETFLQEKYVYSNYNPIKSLRILTNQNAKTLDVDIILTNLLQLISNSLGSNFVIALIFDGEGNVIKNLGEGNKNIKLEDIVQTLSVWRKLNSNRILVYSELKNDKRAGKQIIDQKRETILSFMQKNQIEIIFSLKEYEKFDGAVLIGQNKNRSVYTIGDVDFLDSIVQNTHISLVRAFLYLELQTFNDTLQQKVNEQTQELQIKVKQLEEARRKEADMIDIMGHELRTPATVVKLNIELLKKYIDSNPEEFKQYIDRIGNAVDTEIGLINTLLTSAKLEGNKVEIKHNKVDIKEEIEMSIHGHEKEVREGVSINKNIEKNLPYAYADKIRVAEVLNNLISNAIKYTEKGNISVIASSKGDYIVVSIKDTGKGISKEDMKKLGEKFYRVDNYLESEIVRPGGTGLGLYVTFGLVKLMGGKIEVESTQGVGSKFTFTLPKYKGQQVEVLGTVNRFEKLGLKR